MTLSSGHNTNRPARNFGAVAIGRNEGDRLKQCLDSLREAGTVVYVDSGSTDGSAQWAREQGVFVTELDISLPFTAARARNAGFRQLREIAPDLPYVQFVDGDCELNQQWPEYAASYLNSHSDVGAVCGRRRERNPKSSIYNWLCDREWDGSPGEVRAFGGDVMLRVCALDAVHGYRDDVIAGEEPELCVRLRAAGWRIWRLDKEMVLHDAAMTKFSQWWRRALRSGYGLAQVAYLHGATPERLFVWESVRAWLWGIWVPVACLTASVMFSWGWTAWAIYPLQLVRLTVRNTGPLQDRAKLALFQLLAHFPESLGQIKFIANLVFSRQARIIEYK